MGMTMTKINRMGKIKIRKKMTMESDPIFFS